MATRRSPSAAAAGEFTGFTSGLFRFFHGLARHNEREWFELHRAEYQQHVLVPLKGLVDEMDARFGRIAPEFTGGKRSVFRIHRDIRFSNDKRPYKENAGAWFYHQDAGREGALGEAVRASASFYLHLKPGASFAGGGLWTPERDDLLVVREAIAERHAEWTRLVRALPAALDHDEGAVLTRVPKPYAKDHPAAEWLRFKSFTASIELTDDAVLAADFPDRLEQHYRTLLPLVRWLNAALGHRTSARR